MSNWNRKYRPTAIEQLHLTDVREQLKKLFSSGSFPQALLFAGPKGTGKTSASRIIGATLNDPQNRKALEIVFGNSPGTASFESPDIHSALVSKILQGESYVVNEMDAASNRGIDDIRQLKERVALPPQEGAVSVYILDEAHMLTTEAFNALLKILEEPPKHAIFILATTEMHKLPDTILSRCQLIQFNKASIEELSIAISKVLDAEKIPHDETGVTEIATQSEGSFRDALKLAEFVSRSGKVSQKTVREVSAGSLSGKIETLISALLQKDAKKIIEIFTQLRNQKVQQNYLHTQLLEFLHDSLSRSILNADQKSPLNSKVCIFLLHEYSDEFLTIPSPIPLLPLELKSLEIIERSQKKPPEKPDRSGGNSSSTQKKSPKISETPKSEEAAKSLQNFQMDSVSNTMGDGQLLCKQWEQFAELVSEENSTVAALLRSAKPISGEQGSAIIRVYYTFHQEQLQEPRISAILNKPLSILCGGFVSLTFVKSDIPETAEILDVSDASKLESLAAQALL
ncbi:MAG: DNA polymerase III subunit gamma/tau [Microgenomates group bacterium]